MKITFKDCLSRKRIFAFPEAKHLVDDELKDAEADLQSAKEELSKASFKWTTIKGYYSMFHSARALLYSNGYRERGHYCLYLALKELFVKESLLKDKLCEDFFNSMILREDADYHRKFSQEGASIAIERAGEFLKAAKKILQK
ncbi:MAG: HEPN domain-containing protein [Candidatus Omnitrophica bacterium]|nr:HEPN domain-containing protein [Candidatus Omnitrophota bacterium]MBU1811170.1 HEPN domain-containing protein [Candidatus Omnitrophota bacterium]